MDIASSFAAADLLVPLQSAPVLFFILGAVIALAGAELPFPKAFGKGLAAFLMAAIGLKGGAALAAAGGLGPHIDVLSAALLLSAAIPVVAYLGLRTVIGLDRINAAAVAAHYGSVSLVTFAAATKFLETQGVGYGGHMVAVLALMEGPAILIGLMLAGAPSSANQGSIWREAMANGSVLLIGGAMLIGYAIGKPGMEKLAPFFVAPWDGALSLFLLEMGYLAMARLKDAKSLTAPLIGFGIAMPLAGGSLGLLAALALGLPLGDATLLTVLCASASYIAVPAALRHALPQADFSITMPLSLAVTFPFNVLLGIPLYYGLATMVRGVAG